MKMNRVRLAIGLALVCVLIVGSGTTEAQSLSARGPIASRLVTGLSSMTGSTIGPGGALYAAENTTGRILRVDPRTGNVTTFASGLPKKQPAFPFGGTVDVAFYGSTAYVLVTLVSPDVGGSDVVGIYRVDGPSKFTVIADIGAWSIAHPPNTPFDAPSGAQYALEPYRGGFLVSDGHHNRVLWVSRDGQISEVMVFGNIVPTGLEVRGNTVYMAEAGPVPHNPADGKVVAFGPKASSARTLASGAPLVVDVEFGRGRQLFALSQGTFGGGQPGSPALPNTGSLVRVNEDGTFDVVKAGLDRPTSLEFIGNTAYVVTLSGEIWKIEGVSAPPLGRSG